MRGLGRGFSAVFCGRSGPSGAAMGGRECKRTMHRRSRENPVLHQPSPRYTSLCKGVGGQVGYWVRGKDKVGGKGGGEPRYLETSGGRCLTECTRRQVILPAYVAAWGGWISAGGVAWRTSVGGHGTTQAFEGCRRMREGKHRGGPPEQAAAKHVCSGGVSQLRGPHEGMSEPLLSGFRSGPIRPRGAMGAALDQGESKRMARAFCGDVNHCRNKPIVSFTGLAPASPRRADLLCGLPGPPRSLQEDSHDAAESGMPGTRYRLVGQRLTEVSDCHGPKSLLISSNQSTLNSLATCTT